MISRHTHERMQITDSLLPQISPDNGVQFAQGLQVLLDIDRELVLLNKYTPIGNAVPYGSSRRRPYFPVAA